MHSIPILALNETRKTLLASRLQVVRTHRSVGRAQILPGDGLLFESCRQVNTSGMTVPLDLLFLDADHRVVEKIIHVPPGVVSPEVAQAAGVLELPAGTIPSTHTEIGDHIVIERIITTRAAS